MKSEEKYVRWLEDLGNQDVSLVGGKNASLGEMIGTLKEEGIRVPDGFATTAQAFREYLRDNDIAAKISELMQLIFMLAAPYYGAATKSKKFGRASTRSRHSFVGTQAR